MPKIKHHARKQDLVYEALRGDILDGRFRPGTRLRIDEVAAELGVSHIPIREALKQLQADGYVTIEPYVGTTVAELQADWIHEVFDLMEALEEISGRAACKRMTDEDLKELEGIIGQMDDLVDNPEAWSQANVTLHQFVCEKAGTLLVSQLLGTVLNQWDRLRRHYLKEVVGHRLAEAQKEHWDILKALQRRDEDYVAQVIRTHNRMAFQAYAQYLRLP